MEQINITNSFQEYGFIDVTWLPVISEVTSLNFYIKNLASDSFTLVSSLSPTTINYRYSIPVEQRGNIVEIAFSAYSSLTNEESGLSIVAFDTYPNPPTNLEVLLAKDNKVELQWTSPANKVNIKGYLIERRLTTELEYKSIDIAAENHYIDVGSDFSHPTSQNTYSYRLSSISYLGNASPSIEVAVSVKKDAVVDVNTMLGKKINIVNPSMKFRIKTVGTDGETNWIVRQGLLFNLFQGTWYETSLRISTKTVDGGFSLPVKTQSVLSNIVFNQDEPQMFRLRTIDVDGAQSNAIQTSAQNIILMLPWIVNKGVEPVETTEQKKLTNRSIW